MIRNDYGKYDNLLLENAVFYMNNGVVGNSTLNRTNDPWKDNYTGKTISSVLQLQNDVMVDPEVSNYMPVATLHKVMLTLAHPWESKITGKGLDLTT